MADENIKKTFIYCEKCGKKLIERLPNGMWHFLFGKRNTNGPSPVEMYIHGSVRIKCIRRTCGHWNTLNYFPHINQQSVEPNLD